MKLIKNQTLLIISSILLIISVAYLSKGFYYLLLDTKEGATDLYLRWQEQQYIYHGYYPYSTKEGIEIVIPEIGPITSGGYLPWSFFSGLFFFPPISYPLTRLYHVLLNLISLGILAIFSHKLGKHYSNSAALFTVASVLAISSNCTTLKNGQYGLIINAFLIGFYWLLQNKKSSWAALCLGISMTKPNISAFYFFILIARNNLKSATFFLIYIAFASVYICLLTSTSLLTMVKEFFHQSSFFTARGNSLVNLMLPLGINGNYATLILATLGVIVCMTIFYLYSNYSLLTLFAIASVMGRVCFYHLIYDNVMLVFLLLAVIDVAFKKQNQLSIFILTIVAMSLWLPATTINLTAFYQQKLQFIIWGLVLIYLLVATRRPTSNLMCDR